jgi:hypothetical protein
MMGYLPDPIRQTFIGAQRSRHARFRVRLAPTTPHVTRAGRGFHDPFELLKYMRGDSRPL